VQAVSVALAVKQALVDRNILHVTHEAFQKLLFLHLAEHELGEAHIRRYLIVARFFALRTPLILLLGGPPCSLKSSLAQALAAALNMPNVQQTDVTFSLLRRNVPGMLQPEALPALWLRGCSGPSEVLRWYRQEVELVRRAIDADLRKTWGSGKPLIVEGLHVDPGLFLVELGVLPALQARMHAERLAEGARQEALIKHVSGSIIPQDTCAAVPPHGTCAAVPPQVTYAAAPPQDTCAAVPRSQEVLAAAPFPRQVFSPASQPQQTDAAVSPSLPQGSGLAKQYQETPPGNPAPQQAVAHRSARLTPPASTQSLLSCPPGHSMSKLPATSDTQSHRQATTHKSSSKHVTAPDKPLTAFCPAEDDTCSTRTSSGKPSMHEPPNVGCQIGKVQKACAQAMQSALPSTKEGPLCTPPLAPAGATLDRARFVSNDGILPAEHRSKILVMQAHARAPSAALSTARVLLNAQCMHAASTWLPHDEVLKHLEWYRDPVLEAGLAGAKMGSWQASGGSDDGNLCKEERISAWLSADATGKVSEAGDVSVGGAQEIGCIPGAVQGKPEAGERSREKQLEGRSRTVEASEEETGGGQARPREGFGDEKAAEHTTQAGCASRQKMAGGTAQAGGASVEEIAGGTAQAGEASVEELAGDGAQAEFKEGNAGNGAAFSVTEGVFIEVNERESCTPHLQGACVGSVGMWS
jgi:hypothetical protein